MKLVLGKEKVIVQGMTPEENLWGKYQFPRPYNLGDRLVVSVHVEEDNVYNAGVPCRWFESRDNGENWVEIPPSSAPECGLLLPNGDRFYLPIESGMKMTDYEQTSVRFRTPDYDMDKPAEEGKLPIFDGFTASFDGAIVYGYRADRMPPSLRASEWKVERIPAGSNEVVKETAKVDWKALTRVVIRYDKNDPGTLKPINPRGNLKLGPDGAIWVSAFSGEGHINPENGEYAPYYSAEIFRSDDNGKTFEHRAHMEYPADGKEYPYKSGGFSDSDFEFMPDGSIVWFMRSTWMMFTGEEWAPMYYSRSTDGGYTWSKPVKFAPVGILPRLCTLGNGVTLLCYARPGLYVHARLNDSGTEWSEPLVVMEPGDRSKMANRKIDTPIWFEWEGACGNPELLAISDTEALLFYGDFYYPDENGVKRKTILCRKITVVED